MQGTIEVKVTIETDDVLKKISEIEKRSKEISEQIGGLGLEHAMIEINLKMEK